MPRPRPHNRAGGDRQTVSKPSPPPRTPLPPSYPPTSALCPHVPMEKRRGGGGEAVVVVVVVVVVVRVRVERDTYRHTDEVWMKWMEGPVIVRRFWLKEGREEGVVVVVVVVVAGVDRFRGT